MPIRRSCRPVAQIAILRVARRYNRETSIVLVACRACSSQKRVLCGVQRRIAAKNEHARCQRWKREGESRCRDETEKAYAHPSPATCNNGRYVVPKRDEKAHKTMEWFKNPNHVAQTS